MQVRDWLYVKDHARDPRRAGQRDASARPTTSAAGTSAPTSRSCIAPSSTDAARSGGLRYARLITHVTDRPGYDRRYAIDARKIEREARLAPGRDNSEAASARRCAGISTTPTGLAHVQSGGYRDWVATNHAAR